MRRGRKKKLVMPLEWHRSCVKNGREHWTRILNKAREDMSRATEELSRITELEQRIADAEVRGLAELPII